MNEPNSSVSLYADLQAAAHEVDAAWAEMSHHEMTAGIFRALMVKPLGTLNSVLRLIRFAGNARSESPCKPVKAKPPVDHACTASPRLNVGDAVALPGGVFVIVRRDDYIPSDGAYHRGHSVTLKLQYRARTLPEWLNQVAHGARPARGGRDE